MTTHHAKVRGKVTHLAGQLRQGGAERQLTYLARALQQRGWLQSIISFDQGGIWKDRLEETRLPVLEIPRHPVKLWRLWRLRGCLQRERPAILLSWAPHVAGYSQLLPLAWPVMRVFNVRFNLCRDANTGQPSRLSGLSRRALERSHYAVSNAQASLDALREAGVHVPPAKVIRNIVHGEGLAEAGRAVEVPRIVAVGSLIRRKAVDVLLQALARLASEGSRFELLVAGEGPERAALQDLTSRLGLTDRVRFLGSVKDIPPLLASAHVGVHASLGEGLSNAVLEGMMAGLPMVATAVDGTPEIISDGSTGLLVPPGDAQALAGAIRHLLGDPQLRERLGAAAHQHIERTCSADEVAAQYEAVFEHRAGE